MFYNLLRYVLLGPLIKILFKPQISGKEYIPKTGPVIFVSNHISFFDSIFISLLVPRKVHFIAKAEYFKRTSFRTTLTKYWFKMLGQIPLDRDNNTKAIKTIDKTCKILNDGGTIGVYPEGSRSPDGKIYKGHIGISHLILSTNAIVIPISLVANYIEKAAGKKSKKKKIPNLMQVRIIVSKPLNFSYIRDFNNVLFNNNNHFIKRSIVDTIMYSIAKNSKQNYSDQYSYLLKKRKLS